MSDVYDMAEDTPGQEDNLQPPANQQDQGGEAAEGAEQPPAEKELVKAILAEIRKDKTHHDKAFKRMERSQFMAFNGHDKDWSDKSYKANIVGQHVKTKTAATYAKNPKIVAAYPERMDFALWDENPQTLQLAMQLVQQGAMAGAVAAAQPPQSDPITGTPIPAAPQLPPGYEDAMALVEDFRQGMQRRMMFKKLGKTLEIVFSNAMRQQLPVDFKSGMKTTVRRACTSAVGYVELGFQHEYGISPDVASKLDDFRSRLEHIKRLSEDLADGTVDDTQAEYAELTAAIAAIEAQPQVILRSGLTFDFIESMKVIPSRYCKKLTGFEGGPALNIEYSYTKKQVREIFQHDLGDQYTPYTMEGKRGDGQNGVDYGEDGQGEFTFGKNNSEDDLVRVWKRYDKLAGVVYYVCDGHPQFLQPPAAPIVTVPRFWPVYALTFNEVEHEGELFPKSDVELLADQQNEVNRSRQGKREHRDAARPRWIYPQGTIDEKRDIPELMKLGAFEAMALNIAGETDIKKILQPFPVPGVDPNLYDTNEVLQDASMVAGAQPAQLGGLSKSTATEAAIADASSSSVDGSSIDDLDAFLTMIARDAGQVLLTSMSKDDVVRIAGPGAVWVEDVGLSPEDIFEEVYLQIEAGSTGKPNQAVEIRNMKEIGPLLLQVPGIQPLFLAKEFLRRWDDRLDLTEAFANDLPAIVAQNRNAQPMGAEPGNDPNQQGGQGVDKTSKPSEAAGSGPAMGGNQTSM